MAVEPLVTARIPFDAYRDDVVEPPPGIEYGDLVVTPDMARAFLRLNPRNRNVRRPVVERLLKSLMRGDWKYNGDPLRFDIDGNLLDGQHRLTAQIEADVTLQYHVVAGLPVEAQETMDIGAKRSAGDMLRLRGYANVDGLQAMARLVLAYAETATLIKQRINPTTGQIVQIVERNPDFAECLREGERVNTAVPVLRTSLLGSCVFLFRMADRRDADAFFERLRSGVNLASTDAIYQLRQNVTKRQTSVQQIVPVMYGAWLIKAFNYWREGREVRLLKWTPGGAGAEEYPAIDGVDPRAIKQ